MPDVTTEVTHGAVNIVLPLAIGSVQSSTGTEKPVMDSGLAVITLTAKPEIAATSSTTIE